MSIVKRMLKWPAVYWGPVDPPQVDNFGKKIFEDPVEIKCRWEDCNEIYTNRQGDEAVSNAKVFVDRTLKPTGYLFKGKLADVPDDTDPVASGALEIQKMDEVPGMRPSKPILRTCWL